MLQLQGRWQGQLESFGDSTLEAPDETGRKRGNRPGEIQGDVAQVVAPGNPTDETEPPRLDRVDRSSRQHHVEAPPESDGT